MTTDFLKFSYRLHGVCNENPLSPLIRSLGLKLYRTSGDDSVIYDHDLDRYIFMCRQNGIFLWHGAAIRSAVVCSICYNHWEYCCKHLFDPWILLHFLVYSPFLPVKISWGCELRFSAVASSLKMGNRFRSIWSLKLAKYLKVSSRRLVSRWLNSIFFSFFSLYFFFVCETLIKCCTCISRLRKLGMPTVMTCLFFKPFQLCWMPIHTWGIKRRN